VNQARPELVADLIDLIEKSRLAEKEQALIYRRLAADAEVGGNPELAQRFHDLHADEQHHLSRLSARVLELGGRPIDLSGIRMDPELLQDWEPIIRRREADEVERYRGLLKKELDPDTHALIEAILAVELQHSAELGGKWTMA
jgi:rubrerythrin